jgi:hypothetical protein
MKRLLLLLLLMGCLSQVNQGAVHVVLVIDNGMEKIKRDVELRDGDTVLTLLKKTAEVKYKESASGVFIESIHGISNDPQKNLWWVYSVNDVSASVSCDKYVLKEGDVVRWVLMQFSFS